MLEPGQAGVRAGKRAAPRVRSKLPATVETLGGNRTAVLENVSRTGARIAIDGLREGQQLVLTCRSLDCFAIVQWSEGGSSGLAFDEPLTGEQVLEIRRLSDVGVSLLEQDARAAAADWVEGKLGSACS